VAFDVKVPTSPKSNDGKSMVPVVYRKPRWSEVAQTADNPATNDTAVDGTVYLGLRFVPMTNDSVAHGFS
jgi:hypothetical protein